jgi:hypothetical protein
VFTSTTEDLEQENANPDPPEVTLPAYEETDVPVQSETRTVLECSVPSSIEEGSNLTLSAILFDMDLQPVVGKTIAWSISPGSYNFTSMTQPDGTTELVADLSDLAPGQYGVAAVFDDGSASCAASLLVTHDHGSRGRTPDTTKPALAIISPALGDNIGGPTSGVAAHVTGTSSDDRSGINNVQLRWTPWYGDLTGYRTASPLNPGDWSSWSYDIKFNTDGPKRVLVRSTDDAGNKSWKLTTFDISFVTDDTKPLVSITSPTQGSEFEDIGGSVIHITGTASDMHSGVQMVEVRTDSAVYVLATPVAPDDWSSWQCDVTFATAGLHQITAKVTDNAGNTQWRTIDVTILPADT